MTIIKPMKDGPLVAQGIPNLQDPFWTRRKASKARLWPVPLWTVEKQTLL